MNDDSCNSTKLTIPKPPHPVNRQKKLPWQCHKEIIDDAEAADRIQQLHIANGIPLFSEGKTTKSV